MGKATDFLKDVTAGLTFDLFDSKDHQGPREVQAGTKKQLPNPPMKSRKERLAASRSRSTFRTNLGTTTTPDAGRQTRSGLSVGGR